MNKKIQKKLKDGNGKKKLNARNLRMNRVS